MTTQIEWTEDAIETDPARAMIAHEAPQLMEAAVATTTRAW